MVQVKKKIALALMAFGVLGAPNAYASCCGEVAAIVALQQEVGAGFAAVVASIEVTTKALIQSRGELADAVAVVDTTRTMTQEVVRAIPEYELAPSSILTANSSEVARMAKAGAERNATVFTAQLVDRMLNASRQKNLAGSRYDAYHDYQRNYDPRKNAAMANADVMAETLLSGAGRPGKNSDHTFSPAQVAAAQRYIMNAIGNSQLPTLTASQEATEEGRRYVALQRADAARYAIGQKAFVDALSWKVPVEGLADRLGQTWRSMKGAIVPNASVPDKLSMEGFMVLEVERRYANPQWHVEVSRAAPAAIAREAVFMQALQLRLQMLQIEQNRKLELLLAQLLLNGQSDDVRGEARSLHSILSKK